MLPHLRAVGLKYEIEGGLAGVLEKAKRDSLCLPRIIFRSMRIDFCLPVTHSPFLAPTVVHAACRFMMQRAKVVERFTAHYVFLLGVSRFFSCAHWVLQVGSWGWGEA